MTTMAVALDRNLFLAYYSSITKYYQVKKKVLPSEEKDDYIYYKENMI